METQVFKIADSFKKDAKYTFCPDATMVLPLGLLPRFWMN